MRGRRNRQGLRTHPPKGLRATGNLNLVLRATGCAHRIITPAMLGTPSRHTKVPGILAGWSGGAALLHSVAEVRS